MSLKIKILDKKSGELLEEYPLDRYAYACERARQLEELDLEVVLDIPSVIESLVGGLGYETNSLSEEIKKEIDQHN